MNVHITEIQHFCTHDGPGVRTVVFMNGCPLSCKWCHNPEARLPGNRIFFTPSACIGCGGCAARCSAHTLTEKGHLFDRSRCVRCGACAAACPSMALENTVFTVDTSEVVEEVLKDRAFYGAKGGLTLSGGEPMQQAQAAIEMLSACRKNGLHTAVETCGYFKQDDLPALAETADLLLWDIKDTDEARHRQNTGVSLAPILQNLYAADRLGIKIRLRCICLAGVNANEAHFRRVRAIAQRLDHLLGIDLLPYHSMGKSKYERLGLPDDFDNDRYIPSKEKIEQLRGFVTQGVTFLKHENS